MNDVVAYCGIITATDRKHKNKGWHVELVKLLKIETNSVFASEVLVSD